MRPRHRWPLALAAFALALTPTRAEAGGDTVRGTRGGGSLGERAHEIELSFDRGHASLTVTRTVFNDFDRHDEARVLFTIPASSVATGLRSLGELDGRPRWFEAELLEAEVAAARYAELTGHGVYVPRDPALLWWRDPISLVLQVFPVAPRSEKTVEYTLSMPATWEDGRWSLVLPAMGSPDLPAQLVINPAQRLDQLFVDGQVVGRGRHLTLDHSVVVELAPRDPAPVELALASLDTGQDRSVVQWQVILAPELSKLPRKARIVLALDLSRSLDTEDVEAQRSVALAYLEHFRDPSLGAKVALLGFDRELRPLVEGFVSVDRARTVLADAPLHRRNGSELGLALAEADALLAAQPRSAAKRVVLMSDYATAWALTPELVRATERRSGAIVHLVDASHDRAKLQRDDSHPWSGVAADTTGVLWTLGAPAWSEADDATRAKLIAMSEELARPVRIDELAIRLDDRPVDLGSWSIDLAEGQGMEDRLMSPEGAGRIVVEGLSWNAPVRHEARASTSHGDRWAALVFGSELVDELSEAEMMSLAMRGGAVSPVTSYLAVEPGVRPSTEGIESWERGARGFGGGSGSGSIGLGGGGVLVAGSTVSPQEWLDTELGDAWRTCGGVDPVAKLILEVERAEILEVELRLAHGAKPSSALTTCVTQLAWSVELPAMFGAHQNWTVELD